MLNLEDLGMSEIDLGASRPLQSRRQHLTDQ
jgi:hypothetical protein